MSESKIMDEARIRELLASYGADEARWPAGERAPALDLLAARPDLMAERQQATALDLLLQQAERPAASGALLARLMAAAPRPRRRWLADLWPYGPAWQPAFGLTLALLLGLASGPLLPAADASPSIEQLTTEEIAMLLVAPLYEEEDL